MSPGADKFGMQLTAPTMPYSDAKPAVANGAVTTAGKHKFLDINSPELWLFGIGAATLGLIAVTTSVRVGPLRFTAAAGK